MDNPIPMRLRVEWNSVRNGSLAPDGFSAGSGKKVWWKCRKNPAHEWEAVISSRTNGRGCPFCSNRKVFSEKSLEKQFPNLAKEWHPSRNQSLLPSQVAPFSNKKVWWKCGKGHEWPAIIGNRVKGNGCPYCAGQWVDSSTSFAVKNPELARQWNRKKNIPLTPESVAEYSNRRVWWICPVNPEHEWQATVCDRSTGKGCPYCSGRFATKEENLRATNPELASQWNFKKNIGIMPEQVKANSGKKYWWICPRGHEYQARVASRHSAGTGCPECKSSTSQLELRIFSELSALFPHCRHREKISGIECDVYLTDKKVGIEFDGVYWHKDKFLKDSSKRKKLEALGVKLIRVREKGLEKTDEHLDIVYDKKVGAKKLIVQILKLVASPEVVEQYEERAGFVADDVYMKLLYQLPASLSDKTLAAVVPKIVTEWDGDRNGGMTPFNVSYGSNFKAWWRCKVGHEWQAAVSSRARGQGCPYCSGTRLTTGKSLSAMNPRLAAEWHPTRNRNLLPEQVHANSHLKVWWKCSQSHEWEARVSERNHRGRGCPKCWALRRGKRNEIDSKWNGGGMI